MSLSLAAIKKRFKWKKHISFADGTDNCREFLITKMSAQH